jgi:hypothetical protein
VKTPTDVELIEAKVHEAETVWAQREAAKAAEAALPFVEKLMTVTFGKRDSREGIREKEGKIPVSRSLPFVTGSNFQTETAFGQTIRRYPDGTRTDMQGRRIIENSRDIKAVEKAGYVRDTVSKD